MLSLYLQTAGAEKDDLNQEEAPLVLMLIYCHTGASIEIITWSILLLFLEKNICTTRFKHLWIRISRHYLMVGHDSYHCQLYLGFEKP